MKAYNIEKKELRGNSATDLGRIRPQKLTFGSVSGNMIKKVESSIPGVMRFNYNRYQVLEEKFFEFYDNNTSTYPTELHNIKLLISRSFEVQLWTIVSDLLIANKKQKALYTLFDKLNEQLGSPTNCNNFLIYITKLDLSSDVIVHVLNALSPIKLKLTAWENFVHHATNQLTLKVGPEKAQRLLKVIV